MRNIAALLDSKGHEVWSIGPQDTVYAAIEMMESKGVGALPVMEADKLVGVVSERDYARKVILKGRSSRDCKVSDIMTQNVVCVSPERSVEECMAVMTKRKIRHLPVVKDQTVVGIVSIGDLVKTIIADQKFLIEQLENYITG